MEAKFHIQNRQNLYASLPEGALVVLFAGSAPRQSADAFYPFFANRNFVYLTGIDGSMAEKLIFTAEKLGGEVKESIFLLPPDERAERWNGPRLRPEAAKELSGVCNTFLLETFDAALHKSVSSGQYHTLWLNLDKLSPDEADDVNHCFAKKAAATWPALKCENLFPLVRRLRTIKAPCEISAMRRAMEMTREGILAMMKAAKPGMFEYELKAEFDHALTKRGVLAPAFPSIVSAGENNFCIHYYGYMGKAKDGDMVLNDVGAQWDGVCNDVSRGWPVNGRFNERQTLLYTCAYNTSEYMFSIIKPGMPMAEVDATARRFCFEELKKIGLCNNYEDAGRYIWHGGAHHVGYDVHDVVDYTQEVSSGMVFCVDIGIYCLEWGIGFRLEDNCLVTENGCENLSVGIPRSIDEIEKTMQN